MPTKSKSPIITERHRPRATPCEVSADLTRRLPRLRPPTHPGQMLIDEFLRPLGISQAAFANRLGISPSRLNDIVHGKGPVTPDTALRLERVLGMPADFWLGLQLDWDLWHAMRGQAADEIARLEPLRTGT